MFQPRRPKDDRIFWYAFRLNQIKSEDFGPSQDVARSSCHKRRICRVEHPSSPLLRMLDSALAETSGQMVQRFSLFLTTTKMPPEVQPEFPGARYS